MDWLNFKNVNFLSNGTCVIDEKGGQRIQLEWWDNDCFSWNLNLNFSVHNPIIGSLHTPVDVYTRGPILECLSMLIV